MQIFIINLGKKRIILDVEPSNTIEEVKYKIYKLYKKYPTDVQLFIFAG